MTDLGGEVPCWAHLVDDIDGGPDRVAHVDLSHLDHETSGAVWSLPQNGELDANVVHLNGNDEIGRHVNDDVDVFVVVWHGTGEMTIDDRTLPLRPGIAVLVPRGTSRSIRAGSDPITYLTIHRSRGPLTITRH